MKKFRLSVLLLCLVLCITGMSTVSAEADKPYAGTTITVFNSYDYIEDSVIERFTEATGINVQYVNFTTMEEGYTKFEADPGSYDIVIFSDYMIERMIANGLAAELDKSAMPNIEGLIDWMKTPDYDPTGSYSVPYMWGTMGILYNTEMVDEEITSWHSIFDSKYQNAVFMLNSIRDTIGVTLKMLGYSVNEHSEEALSAVRDTLIAQDDDGIVAGYHVDEIKDKMIAGEAAFAVMWSGDAAYAIYESEGDYLKYVIPEEGSNVWVDAMAIPAASANKEAAQCFIDFVCDPEIAFINQQYIYYCTPIAEARDMMTEEELAMEVLNPSDESLSRCEFFQDIPAEYLEAYEDVWMEIRMGG